MSRGTEEEKKRAVGRVWVSVGASPGRDLWAAETAGWVLSEGGSK